MVEKTLNEHLFGSGPKRILTLDGGGIRGVLTLGYLKSIESILRERAGGDPNFRLCDYFDLIAGTSTGSIIAAGLALGFTVEKLQEIYKSLANEVFTTSFFRRGMFIPKFSTKPLLKALEEYYGDVTLGSNQLRTGLLVITKRLDTGSTWPLHNNPKGKYFNPIPGDDTTIPNRDYLLRDIIRASTAAPHYFEPEKIQIANDKYGAFVDGGISPHNNPSLQTLLIATTQGYGFNWSFGENQLLIASVGTGLQNLRMDPKEVLDMPALELAGRSLLSVMADTGWLEQAIMQWISNSPTSWKIDTEMGNLQEDILGNGKPLVSYLRYDVSFDTKWIKDNLGLEMSKKELKSLEEMDNSKNVEQLFQVGTKAASIQIKPAHFPDIFDLK
ncbi:patatin-like phospholipase family protein [Candidatus Parabeggiatoa sp. HSG14]|uniref:patatin-like phospholipase family protein n=1 Tax=Candidatus Parabeggiatoa sp. HSG14 TaxID=3055593 RepID=UPI0025A71663|nr:patatin-like phospholipase family protein [Thiotrichales bacterium HSG14]